MESKLPELTRFSLISSFPSLSPFLPCELASFICSFLFFLNIFIVIKHICCKTGELWLHSSVNIFYLILVKLNFLVPQFPNMLFNGDLFLKNLLAFSALAQIKSKTKILAHINCPVNGN